MAESVITELLTEKFRPKKFQQMILSSRIKKSFPNGQLTQNILLAGTQGAGKTSLARVLAADYCTLYINISSERGIDVVREKITEFASTRSIIPSANNDYKVVILDEMDGGTDALFKALRATMEKFAKTTRFIGTCNYLNKIPDPIQSRFDVVLFDPQSKEEEEEVLKLYAKRVKQISDKIELEWESNELIFDFVKRNFPDMRKNISILQRLKNTDGLEVIKAENIVNSQYSYLGIYKLITSQSPSPNKTYEYVISNYSGKSADIFKDLAFEFPSWFLDNHSNNQHKLPLMIQSIADWDYKRNFHIDENLGILACIFQCQSIFNSK